MRTYYYIDGAVRDAHARDLKRRDPRASIVRRSHRNVQLDPSHVTGAVVSASDRNQFGGFSPRFFPVLYVIEVR